jgi:hypothetical protein
MMEVNEHDVIVNIDNNNPASTADTPESQIIMSEDVVPSLLAAIYQ